MYNYDKFKINNRDSFMWKARGMVLELCKESNEILIVYNICFDEFAGMIILYIAVKLLGLFKGYVRFKENLCVTYTYKNLVSASSFFKQRAK